MSGIDVAIESCASQIPPATKDPEPGEAIWKILSAMNVQACKSSSLSACMQAKGGAFVVSAEANACVSGESSQGCESLAMNYSQTITAKNIIQCAVTSKIQRNTSDVNVLNKITVVEKEGATLECCLCKRVPGACPEPCAAIMTGDQENDVKLSFTATFDSQDTDSISEVLTDAIAKDISTASEVSKTGSGANPGSKSVSVSDVRSMMNNQNVDIKQIVAENLQKLTAENIQEFEVGSMSSYGPCLVVGDQRNVIDVVISDMVSSAVQRTTEILSKTDLKEIMETISKQDLEGLDVSKAITSSTIGKIVMLIVGVALLGGAYKYYNSQKNGMGSVGANAARNQLIMYGVIGIGCVILLFVVYKFIKDYISKLNPFRVSGF